MKEVSRVNYLHYGDALQRIRRADLSSDQINTKQQLLSSIENGYSNSRFIRAIVESYGGSRSSRLDVTEFKLDLSRTTKMRNLFSSLGCRGFSYKFFTDMAGFPYRLRSRVNLRVALVADQELFYPPKVRKYLTRHRANHYFVYQAPAIAFALGIITRKIWYVFVMQSDIVRRGSASVREHFRGWRKVLFNSIIDIAKETADYIYLCREEDVLKACHRDFPGPESPPENWRIIYHGTASDFAMARIELKRRINIQLYDRKHPIYSKSMYYIYLNKKPKVRPRSQNGDVS